VDGEKEMGTGVNKKASKRMAAELLLKKLKEKSQTTQVAHAIEKPGNWPQYRDTNPSKC
jgi:hypothetical protein